MARLLRIEFPGAVYHATSRGNARKDIFEDGNDRFRFYLFLQRTVERFECHLNAFCLMTNRIDLILQSGDVTLSRFRQNISQRSTSWTKFSLARTGNAIQERLKALLINVNAYLLEVEQYTSGSILRHFLQF